MCTQPAREFFKAKGVLVKICKLVFHGYSWIKSLQMRLAFFFTLCVFALKHNNTSSNIITLFRLLYQVHAQGGKMPRWSFQTLIQTLSTKSSNELRLATAILKLPDLLIRVAL